jgi:hypothetical protein
MSYNIDKFKVKQLKDLVIPVASLYEHQREDLHPTKMFSKKSDSWVRFEFMEILQETPSFSYGEG